MRDYRMGRRYSGNKSIQSSIIRARALWLQSMFSVVANNIRDYKRALKEPLERSKD